MTRLNIYKKSRNLIEEHGFLLVFPQGNKENPQSLWSLLYPGSPLVWEWDDSADNRVVQLWRVREHLAQSKDVIYGKYYQGRATFFSKKVFRFLLAAKGSWEFNFPNPMSKEILQALEMDSPLSTKQLKRITGLQGKMLESTYHKALRDLWENFLIVSLGEIDDGAFPSLAHAATQIVFEELWLEAQSIDPLDAMLALTDLNDWETFERVMLTPKPWRQGNQ